LIDHAAEQNFDNRKRQCDGDDHHHHAGRRDLNDIDP
jgi:hypothetical protein